MATTEYGNLVNYACVPTENDHYGSGYGGTGAGRIPQELTFLPLLRQLGSCTGFVESGFAVPSTGSLIADKIVGTVTAGAAVIDGCRIVGTSTITVNMTKSSDNYLWLKLELDGNGKIYRPVIHIDTAYTIPSHATPLGKVVCGASSVSSTVDYRYQNRHIWGWVSNVGDSVSIVHPGSGDWTAANSGTDLVVTFKTAFLRSPMSIVFQSGVTFPTTTTSTITWPENLADNLFFAIG